MDHLAQIRDQFTRQREAYLRMSAMHDEATLKRTAAMCQVRPSDEVLDVACGPGFLTRAFAPLCRAVTGFDATEPFLQFAAEETAKLGMTNIEWVHGDAEGMPFEDGRFDLAACRAAFHHMPRPERVLAEMKRITKSGGRIVIIDMIASEDAAKAEYQHRVEQLCDPTHFRALSEREFERLFADAGLALTFKGRGETKYPLRQWIEHGGPSPEAAREIERLVEASVDRDLAGLRVWRENGEVFLAHQGAAFMLRKD